MMTMMPPWVFCNKNTTFSFPYLFIFDGRKGAKQLFDRRYRRPMNREMKRQLFICIISSLFSISFNFCITVFLLQGPLLGSKIYVNFSFHILPFANNPEIPDWPTAGKEPSSSSTGDAGGLCLIFVLALSAWK